VHQPTEEIAKQHTDGIGIKVEPLAGTESGTATVSIYDPN
jgi:hypothetical protein